MSRNIAAFMKAFELAYKVIWNATRSPAGYYNDGVITFVLPFVNVLILGSWLIRFSTRRIHNNRFYFRLEIVNLDSDAAASLAAVRVVI
jgi:hypothetical protein